MTFFDKWDSIEAKICSQCMLSCDDPSTTLIFGQDDGQKFEPCSKTWNNGQNHY